MLAVYNYAIEELRYILPGALISTGYYHFAKKENYTRCNTVSIMMAGWIGSSLKASCMDQNEENGIGKPNRMHAVATSFIFSSSIAVLLEALPFLFNVETNGLCLCAFGCTAGMFRMVLNTVQNEVNEQANMPKIKLETDFFSWSGLGTAYGAVIVAFYYVFSE
eukprot:UN11188